MLKNFELLTHCKMVIMISLNKIVALWGDKYFRIYVIKSRNSIYSTVSSTLKCNAQSEALLILSVRGVRKSQSA